MRKGHKWQETIEYRIKNPECPVCSGKIIVPGVNDLATLYPEIALEWDYDRNHGIRPENMPPHSGKRVHWKCKKGHLWESTIDNRTSGRRCPVCYGNKVVEGENDLATLYPDIAAEWDYEHNEKTPQQVRAKSSDKVYWKCKNKGHIWEACVYQRVLFSTGCPCCSRKCLVPGENDLATVFPEVAKTWDYERNNGVTPSDVTATSDYYAAWVCEKGHRWVATVNARTNCTKSGCPYCEHKRPISGETDLPSHNPELLPEWDYEKNFNPPEFYSYGSTAKVWWKCKNRHRWRAFIHTRTRGSQCSICRREGLL